MLIDDDDDDACTIVEEAHVGQEQVDEPYRIGLIRWQQVNVYVVGRR
jgi:hypothetical protein